jgi:Tol biopolymer transport system component
MPVADPDRPGDPITLGGHAILARVVEGGMGVIDRDRHAAQPADPDRWTRRRRRRWAGVLLALAGLATVLAILLPRLGATPEGGPRGGRPAAANPSTSDGAALPAWGLLYAATATATGTPTSDIWVANPNGTGQRNLTRDAAQDTDPAWSPDGRRIVYASTPSRCQGSGCQQDLYAISHDGRNRVRLTSTPQDERQPDWSPDGTRIAYARSGDGDSGIWVMRADGSSQRQLTNDPGFAPDWAPDDTRILYIGGDYRLHTINADGTGRRRIGNVGPIRSARWSPDGARIALTMRDAVWIINADGTGLHRIRQSAAYPSWTPDGRHLVFTAYASAPTGGPELRRIDADGRNEIVLGRDQAGAAPTQP